MNNRLIIYFFYDPQGKVDRYIEFALSSLKNHCNNILIVVNGELEKESRDLLEKYTSKILVRENKGFDVWAYKDAMDSMGWKELIKYEEIILMNYTIMGPIYPLSEVFDVMDKKKIDFWGLTKCLEEKSAEAQEMWNNPYGYIPEHVQSSFMAFRQKFVKSTDFQNYWNDLPEINSYYESGGTHEQVFTKYFADKGYTWDVYTNIDDMDKEVFTCSPLINYPLEMVKEKRTPFFKRRTFFTTKMEFMNINYNVNRFLDFLEKETDYDLDFIMESLIRTSNQRDLLETMLNTHIIDE